MRFLSPTLCLLAVLPATALADKPGWNAHCPPGMRWDFQLCRELEPSGPGRGTLHTASWGTVYFLRSVPLDLTQTLSEKRVVTPGHLILARPTLDGGYTLTDEPVSGERRELRLQTRGEDLSVHFGQVTAEFDRGPSGLTLKIGDKVMHYERTLTGFVIKGPKGQVEYSRDLAGTETITSPAGVTRYENNAYKGASVSGIPLENHPHLGRVASFQIHNTGFMVNLWALANVAPGTGIASAMYWEPAIIIGDVTPAAPKAP